MIHTFLIATNNYLLRVAVDLEANRLIIDQINDGGVFFGVTFIDGDLTYSRRQRIQNPYGDALPFVLPDRIYRAGRPLGVDFMDVHQMIWHDGHLFIAECFRNRLVIVKGPIDYDWTGYEQEDVIFSSTASDMNHPNSVTPVTRNHVAVVLHNGPWRREKNSEIFLIRVAPPAIQCGVELPYQGCHNLVFDDKLAYVNASQDGKIGVFDVTDTWSHWELVREIPIAYEDYSHNKGMALTDEHIVVGLSRDANWHQRFYGDAFLVFVPRESGKQGARIRLHDVGNINEIVYIGSADCTRENYEPRPAEHIAYDWDTEPTEAGQLTTLHQ